MSHHIPDAGKMVSVPEIVIDRVLFEHGYDRTEGTSRAILSALSAAGWVVVPVELLTELADDLESEITANRNNERVMRRDMEPVYRARALLAAALPAAPEARDGGGAA